MDKRTFATRREALEAGPLFPHGGRWIEGVVEFIAAPPHLRSSPLNFRWMHPVYAFPVDPMEMRDVYHQLGLVADQLSQNSQHGTLLFPPYSEQTLSAKLNPNLTGMEPALSKGGGK